MKKSLLTTLVLIVFVIGGFFLLSTNNTKKNQPPLPSSHEYFWGQGCPHCATVEKFLSDFKSKEKIQIEKKEIYNNADNAKLMAQRAAYCNIPNNQLGVPFFFTPDGRCIVGDEPIIEYLENLE